MGCSLSTLQKNNGNKKAGDKQNKENASLTVVLKVDCLCEGCASKILKCVRELEGVETVKTESNSNKVTVIGAVDPTAIKDNIAKKSKKKVDVVSPQPKKDDNKEDKKPGKDKNQGSDDKQEKKPKEAPLTTVDLKVQLKCQCQGCILKIRRIVFEAKGVHELKVDTQKELVTVKGTMDVKALAEALKDKLKKNVEIVPPPKKEKESNKDGGNDGGNSGGGGGGKKNKKGGNGGNDANSNAATDGGGGGKNKTEGNRMGFMAQPEYGYGYTPCYPGYGQPGYGYYYGHPLPHGYGHCYPGYGPNYPVFVHPPHQMFNDENANACAIL
ncbi:HEAVY METAL ASSOCIATED PROTEIN 53, EAVY METAL-ASSOCIATED ISOPRENYLATED PLANT PROTEIN3 [Hibiscus trionum]|uniref:HEAVY METAL ASSOCIATED PROTEIN 53, EAVY METAL-ASSOCIATED ISOPRENYLATED PLANT PROTEIN3 n=1 Tax=Hibiscus trionum TaxID=183268 RepID=A0A9W7HPT5_HIBTR|nr:HEAVY METAL ASSOCIATED PROTEIN 53, EAVY METAL-ASSOCIATED ISOPRENYLATED PLANT PROTEIN3 [Hibiscus trionum]